MRLVAGRPITRAVTPALIALLAAAMVGCSWLIGVSEDPVVDDPGMDSSVDAEPEREDARDAALLDRADRADAPDG